jgi:hypothetical protein
MRQGKRGYDLNSHKKGLRSRKIASVIQYIQHGTPAESGTVQTIDELLALDGCGANSRLSGNWLSVSNLK